MELPAPPPPRDRSYTHEVKAVVLFLAALGAIFWILEGPFFF